MRELGAGGHDPAMTPGRWQKERGFESQVLALDLSLNPAGPCSAVSFRFPICDGGQCYPGFRGVCENYKGSRAKWRAWDTADASAWMAVLPRVVSAHLSTSQDSRSRGG